MPRSRRPLEIHKFGGASLANGAAIAHAVSVIRAQRPAPLVVVVSAMAGVTDALLDLASAAVRGDADGARATLRSEEHTSELQSQSNLVCRLLLEKKKQT